MPIRPISAESTIRLIYRGRINPITKSNEIVSSKDWIGAVEDDSIYTFDYLADDCSYIASAHKKWPLPSVAVVSNRFFPKSRNRTRLSKKVWAEHYDCRCVICTKQFHWSDFTKEHAIPRAKGGTDDFENILPACFECNNKKGDQFPYYDVHGVPVEKKNKPISPVFIGLPKDKIKEDWKPFLFKA